MSIEWRAVARGALVGFAVIVPVTIVQAVLRREVSDYDNSGWRYPLFVLILAAYLAAGWFAARTRTDEPLTYGTLGGVGTLLLWIPTRIVIWAVREDDRGLFTGDKAALRPGQLFGQLVIAAAFGMLGGWAAARRARRVDAVRGKRG
jgi:uncharacterized membrane protein (DUF485 family)